MGLLNFWKKKNPSAVVGLTSENLGLFHIAYENKRSNLPSPGAPAYAYETLGLAVHSPIGPTVAVRTPLRFAVPTTLYNKAVPLQGLPTVTGALVKQPLFNPETGGFAVSPSGLINNPFPKELTSAAGHAL